MKLLADACSTIQSCIGSIIPPDPIKNIPGGTGEGQINSFLGTIISLIFMAAAVVFIFMILFAGFQWLSSGGDKESIAKARGRLTWAIIGITILALTFVIAKVLSTITGFSLFTP